MKHLPIQQASPSAPQHVALISMPRNPHRAALQIHGTIQPDGALLVTFDRSRLTEELAVAVLGENLGAFNYATGTMPTLYRVATALQATEPAAEIRALLAHETDPTARAGLEAALAELQAQGRDGGAR